MFRWTCLGLAAAAALALGWMVNDLRVEARKTTTTVNEKLPEILEKTRRTSEVLAELAEDVRQLRHLAGVSTAGRDKGLVAYADGVLSLIAGSGGRIGLKPKLFGNELKEVAPAADWVAGARKEALWLTVSSSSRADLLTRLCQNLYGSKWYLQPEGGEAVPLEEWIKTHHPDSQEGRPK